MPLFYLTLLSIMVPSVACMQFEPRSGPKNIDSDLDPSRLTNLKCSLNIEKNNNKKHFGSEKSKQKTKNCEKLPTCKD